VEIETDSEPTEKRYRLTEIKPLDPFIHAEIGVMVHSIRSSLVILACTPESKSTHFPIWKNESDFLNPRSRPWEYIKRLTQIDQDIIKDLAPHPRGNPLLCALHDMDLTRKHRRLLNTYVLPQSVHLHDADRWTAVATGGPVVWDARYLEQKPIVAATDAAMPDRNISITMQVTFDEPDHSRSDDFAGTFRNFRALHIRSSISSREESFTARPSTPQPPYIVPTQT